MGMESFFPKTKSNRNCNNDFLSKAKTKKSRLRARRKKIYFGNKKIKRIVKQNAQAFWFLFTFFFFTTELMKNFFSLSLSLFPFPLFFLFSSKKKKKRYSSAYILHHNHHCCQTEPEKKKKNIHEYKIQSEQKKEKAKKFTSLISPHPSFSFQKKKNLYFPLLSLRSFLPPFFFSES